MVPNFTFTRVAFFVAVKKKPIGIGPLQKASHGANGEPFGILELENVPHHPFAYFARINPALSQNGKALRVEIFYCHNLKICNFWRFDLAHVTPVMAHLGLVGAMHQIYLIKKSHMQYYTFLPLLGKGDCWGNSIL